MMGRARLPVVLAWAAVAATALIAATAVLLDALPLGSGVDPAGTAVVLAWLTYAVVGAVISIRRPGDRIGALLLAMGLASELLALADQFAGFLQPTPFVTFARGNPIATWIVPLLTNFWVVSFSLLAVLMLVFPTGRPLSPGWRPAVWLAFATIPLGLVTSGNVEAYALRPFPLLDVLFGPETGAALREEGQGLVGMLQLGLYVVGAVSLVVRYRRAGGVERQQLKWLAYAALVFAVVSVGTAVIFFSPLRALDPGAPIPPAVFGGVPFILALVAIPIAVAIAILRYRLYDIDLLINRTLVYGALSVVLAIAYFGSVVALQWLLSPLTAGSQLAVAGSTLAVAGLVQPLRRRIHDAVDRRFYRSRYDAQRTLERFGARLRDELDLDALSRELIGVVRETVQPAHASVWLRERVR
jgi:hypothetical protein